MKKLISVVSAIALILCFSFAESFAFYERGEITAEEYSKRLGRLTGKYDAGYIDGAAEGKTDPDDIQLNRLIIKTKSNRRLWNDFGAVAKIEGYDGIHIMQYSSAQEAESAYEYFKDLPNVESVEHDFYYQGYEHESEYINYDYEKQYLSWGSTVTKANSAVSYADFFKESNPEIIVAVIDTGIDSDHPFLKSRIVNSRIDLVQNDGEPEDDSGHGTHVAGIVIDNTADNVKVSGYKVLDKRGYGYYSITCSAIDLAVERGVDVINMSLRWIRNEDNHSMFENSVKKAVNKGIAVVVAAGNESTDAVNVCPASNSNVIAVASISPGNSPSYFSNYGECVDIAAPGSGINSSVIGGGYAQKTGTSMATPFVSAAVAFLKTLNANYTPSQIEKIIKENAFVPEGWNSDFGAGILDFSKIVKNLISDYPEIKIDKNNKAEIISKSENAVVYYTTDGRIPSAGFSKIYRGPFDVKNAVSIRAVACEAGKYPSIASTVMINRSAEFKIRYKGTKDMELPSGSEIVSCKSSNEASVVADVEKRKLYGVSVGKSRVVVVLDSGQKVTYDVTVEYQNWQLIIFYFLLGFLWY